jgi:cytochrome b561/polyisoprenoid-binding protein YceI
MTYERYSKSAMLLHWLLALLLVFQLALGWRLEDLKGIVQFNGYQLHKSIGITILLLSLIRLGLRLTRRPPAAFADIGWARTLAGAVHWAFYLVLIGGPLTGWLIVSTGRVQVPTVLFGTIPWPHLPAPRSIHEPAEALHSALAIFALVLFGLHLLGALRHQFIKREQVLPRMMPTSGGRLSALAAGIAVILALLALFAASSLGWFMPLGGTTQPPQPSLPLPTQTARPAPRVAPAETPDLAANPIETEEPAKASNWKIRPGGALNFAAHWNGQPVKGRFARWDADIRFGPDALADSRIDVRIDLASVDTDDGQRDETLRGSDFFDVASHAEARFRARDVRKVCNDRYRANGQLDLHGIEKPVPVRFTLKIKGDVATVRGSASLERTAFGVGAGQWAATDTIADPVTIDFAFTADREDS